MMLLPLYLVKECKEREEDFGTQFTDKILAGDADHAEVKVIGQLDREKRIALCEGKASQKQQWQAMKDG